MATKSRWAAALIVVVLSGACSSGSTEADTSEPAPTTSTEPDTTDETIDGTAEAAPPSDGEELVVPPCPTAPEAQTLERVAAGAADLPGEGVPLEPGVYADERLGVAIAVEPPPEFVETSSWQDTTALYGAWSPSLGAGLVTAFLRPAGYVAETPTPEQNARGEIAELIDLDDWLESTGVTVIDDTPTAIDDRPARSLTFSVPDAIADPTFGDVPLTPTWAVQTGEFEHRVIEVDLGADTPPLIIYGTAPDEETQTAVDAAIASVQIGDVGERPRELYRETPWDVGNLFQPALVGACVVPAVAFDGVTFELSEPAYVEGSGDELFITSTNDSHAGFLQPYVEIVRPDRVAEGGTTGPPTPGAVVATEADALAELEAEGYTLNPLDDAATILGYPATGYEFQSGAVEPWLWFPRSHAVSRGDGLFSDPPQWQGILRIAETPDGVIIVMAGGEVGTDDAQLVMPLFDDLMTSLMPATS